MAVPDVTQGVGRPAGATHADAAADLPGPQRTGSQRAADLISRYAVVIALAALIVVFSLLIPEKFATAANFRAMVNAQATVLLLAIAATVPLRTGDFDLSIASMMTVTAAITAVQVNAGYPLIVPIVLCLLAGLAVGLINGFLVVKMGVDSFIVTLGGMTALAGATFAITNSKVIFGLDGTILSIARFQVLGVPALTWYGWLLVLVAWYVYERTPVGRYLLFVGGSREAARLAGLPVDRIRMGAFVASALIASAAGVLLVGRLAAIDPSIGGSFLLQPFAAAFLGATTICVGRFNAFGTLVALYLLVVGITGLQLLGAAPWVANVFNGLALVMAVTLARVASRRGSTG